MNTGKTVVKVSVIFLLLMLWSCAGVDMNKLAKEQQMLVNPNPLELHGDSVKFEMSALLPVKMLKKNKIYTVEVTYRAFENKVNLGKVVFDGNDFPKAAVEQPKVSKNFVFAYDKVLKKGDVMVTGEMADPGRPGKKTPELSVAKGIITTPLWVQPMYPVVYADHGYDNREKLAPTVVNFYFQKRSPKLEDKERKSDRAKFFEKFIASKYVTRTVNIIGTHSPEGLESFNEKLSEQRAMTIEKYYREMMKKFNYKSKADSITFVIKGKVKDWNEFKAALASYKKISEAEKSEILAIIDAEEGSFQEKEVKLQKLKTYKLIYKDLYPGLRNARTEVLTVVPQPSDAEIFLKAQKIASGTAGKADSLSDAQLLYAATLTPSPEEKEAIYSAAVKRSDAYEAHLNLGAIYLEKAKKEANPDTKKQWAEKALAKLEIAKNKKESAEVYINLSSARLMLGNKAGALEAAYNAAKYPASPDASKALNALQGVLDIKNGNYASAVTSLTNAGEDAVVLFNRSLALLLKKEYQSAKSAMQDAISKDAQQAVFYYIAAIIETKLGDMEAMKRNLTMAFKLDDGLKRIALDDLEFANVKDLESFKEALK